MLLDRLLWLLLQKVRIRQQVELWEGRTSETLSEIGHDRVS
jgi:hypothetical protein